MYMHIVILKEAKPTIVVANKTTNQPYSQSHKLNSNSNNVSGSKWSELRFEFPFSSVTTPTTTTSRKEPDYVFLSIVFHPFWFSASSSGFFCCIAIKDNMTRQCSDFCFMVADYFHYFRLGTDRLFRTSLFNCQLGLSDCIWKFFD